MHILLVPITNPIVWDNIQLGFSINSQNFGLQPQSVHLFVDGRMNCSPIWNPYFSIDFSKSVLRTLSLYLKQCLLITHELWLLP